MLQLKSIDSQIENLIQLRGNKPFDIFKFEGALFIFMKQYGAKSTVPLMILFQDDFDFPEAMFSVIHGISGDKYVDGMMEGLHVLLPRAPEWAATLVARILNSPRDAQSAVESLSKTKEEYKNSWKLILLKLNIDMPEFDTKTAPLLNALKS